MTAGGTPPGAPPASQQSGHEQVVWTYDDSQEGQGFVSFAAVMIALAAVINTLYGIAAISKASFFVGDARYVFGDLKTWGWFLLALGIAQAFAVAAIWRGASWGRWFGVACVSVNAILQLMWFPGRPILALSILLLDLVALYGLLAHGGRRREAREKRAAAR